VSDGTTNRLLATGMTFQCHCGS